MRFNTRILRASLLASAATFCLTAPELAHAQQAGSGVKVDEIIVTGSRIRRDTFDAPLPLATVDAEQIRASGRVNLGDTLLEIPQVDTNSNSRNTSSTLFTSGQQRVDLRGLGSSRTLVLMDGRRHINTDASSPAVDLNVIPSLMIERVDVQPGGVSAVYGSEAIAGVVNLIMKKSFDGWQFDVQGGQTQQNDGQEFVVGAMWGHHFFDDRLSVLVGAEVADQEPIMRRDRADQGLLPGIRRDTTQNPQTIVLGSRSNTSPYATFQFRSGAFNGNPLLGVTEDVRDPTKLVQLTGACAPAVVLPSCQDPALFYSGIYDALQGRTRRGSIRGYIDYKLTDHVKLFGEASFARVDGYGYFQPAFSSASGGGTLPATLKGDNAFLTTGTTAADAQMRAYWTAAFGATGFSSTNSVNVGKFWQEFGGRDSNIRRDVTRVVGGMEGDVDAFARNFHWDWYAQHGELKGTTIALAVPNIQRVQQSIDAVVVGGQIVCRDATARAAGCVPWNLIDGANPGAVAWANATATSEQSAKQTVVAANLTFDLLQLPAGPLGVAVGAEYRKDESTFVQDPLSATGALFFNAIGTRKGEFDVKEAFAEARVPLLRDLPFFHDLSIEGAVRGSDYSTIGSTTQWRVAGNWAPIRDLRFRGSIATAVRAPNIVELFSPQSRNFTTSANDPCDKDAFRVATAGQQAARRITCAAAIQGWNPATFVSNIGTGRPSLALLQGGNPDLGPETAKTYDVGFVFQPRWVPGLQFSLDFFKYNISNEVGTIPVNTLFQQLCYDAATPLASNPFCALIQRDPTGTNGGAVPGGVTQVVLTNQNVAKVKVEGFDASLAYSFDVADVLKDKDFGRIGLRLDATDMYNWALQGLPNQSYTQFANTINNATPRWKAAGTLSWTWDRLYVGWTTHFIGSMIANNAFQPSALAPYFTGDYYEYDLRARYKINDDVSVRAGVLNITDKYPPYLPETFLGTGVGSSAFTNAGRFFYVGATLRY